jgi:hypothetical protein
LLFNLVDLVAFTHNGSKFLLENGRMSNAAQGTAGATSRLEERRPFAFWGNGLLEWLLRVALMIRMGLIRVAFDNRPQNAFAQTWTRFAAETPPY